MTRFAIASFVLAGSAVAMLEPAHGQGVQYQFTPPPPIRTLPSSPTPSYPASSEAVALAALPRHAATGPVRFRIGTYRSYGPRPCDFRPVFSGRDVRRPRFELRTRRRVGRTGPQPVKRIHGPVCELTTDRMSKHNSPPNMGELRRPNTLSRRRSNAWKICASWVDAVAISTIIHIQPPRYVGTVQGGEGEEVSPAFCFDCVRRPEVVTLRSTPPVR